MPFKIFYHQHNRDGFTLAEVLITLGIIGVVAAMTMPTLISNHRKSTISAKLKKFYTVMSQAVILAEAEQGASPSLWDSFSSSYNGEEMEAWFNKYLKSHLNVLSVIPKSGGYVYVALNDGSGFIIFNHFQSVDSIHVYYCIDFKKCTAKTDGKNIFTFRFINEKFSTYVEGTTLTIDELMSPSAFCGCSKEQGVPHSCSTVLQKNNWEFPDNYPFKI